MRGGRSLHGGQRSLLTQQSHLSQSPHVTQTLVCYLSQSRKVRKEFLISRLSLAEPQNAQSFLS